MDELLLSVDDSSFLAVDSDFRVVSVALSVTFSAAFLTGSTAAREAGLSAFATDASLTGAASVFGPVTEEAAGTDAAGTDAAGTEPFAAKPVSAGSGTAALAGAPGAEEPALAVSTG